MRPSTAELPGSGLHRPADETASRSRGEPIDYLSALPDDLLHRITSSLKVWDVLRTSVLARRWRHLWESAPCFDFRIRSSKSDCAPDHLCDLFYHVFLFREASVPLDTLRLRSSCHLGAFDDHHADTWIRAAMRLSARVIHVVGHRRFPALFKGVNFVSCHLKVLKLSYARLDGRILGQLSSSCTYLEELDLKDCSLTGDEIVSASLKTLIMLNCKTSSAFSVAAPSLVLLRVITPYARVPSFKNLGSLVAATILIDDIFLSDDISEDDAYDETTDDDNWSHSSEHVTDQEDGEETTDDDDDDGDNNTNNGSEHITDQEDCDGTTDADDDNSNYGSEHIFDQESCDETTDGHDNSNHGSEHIIDQGETADNDDNSKCGSEHIIDQEGCDENTDDDNCSYVSEHIIDQEDCDETTDDEGHDNEDTDKRENYKVDDDFGYTSEGDDFEENIDEEDGSDNSTNCKIGYGRGGQEDNYGHDSDIDSDVNTYEYSEIAEEAEYDYHSDSKNSSKDANYDNYEINASEYLGGQNILRSLSNVTSLGLLTDAGEVVLSRELKRCPTFSNLKTLSLGEWCMAADFDAVIFLLQHSPNIERLFLQLKLNFDNRSRKAFETGIKLQGRSFTCKDLQMVKIKCSKDDGRVHKLANLFIANGIPLEKISVRRTGSAYLRARELTDQAMHELMLFGENWTHTKVLRFLERSSLVDGV